MEFCVHSFSTQQIYTRWVQHTILSTLLVPLWFMAGSNQSLSSFSCSRLNLPAWTWTQPLISNLFFPWIQVYSLPCSLYVLPWPIFPSPSPLSGFICLECHMKVNHPVLFLRPKPLRARVRAPIPLQLCLPQWKFEQVLTICTLASLVIGSTLPLIYLQRTEMVLCLHLHQ